LAITGLLTVVGSLAYIVARQPRGRCEQVFSATRRRTDDTDTPVNHSPGRAEQRSVGHWPPSCTAQQ